MRKLLLSALVPVGLAAALGFSGQANAAPEFSRHRDFRAPSYVQHTDYYWQHHHYHHRKWDERHHHWEYYE
jgi:hypothetical protein